MGDIKRIGSIALVLLFSNAQAGEIISTVFEKADKSSGFRGSVEVTASGGMIEDSITGGFSLLFEGGYSGLSFAAAAPLRFTDEKSQEGKRTLIKIADWDEISDFTRIIPYVSYGGNDTAYHLYAGLLSGVSMGHSSIVDRYYGVIDTDHYQSGVYLRYFEAAFGGEVLLDNYLDPSWTAVRGYIRPLAFMNPPDFLKRVTVGFTAATDFLAPVKVKRDSKGAIILDRYYLPENETDEISVTGFEADWMIVADRVFDFSLYFDYNLIAGLGEGLHTGFIINAEGDRGLKFFSRLEYRYMSTAYLPSYFNALYEIERVTFLEETPKLRYLRENAAGPWLHGLVFECGIKLKKRLKLTAKIEGSEGSKRNGFSFGMILPDIYGLSFSMNYIKRNFTEVYNIFNPEDALFASEARLPLAGNFFIFGQFFQDFAVAKAGGLRGSYLPRQSFFTGIGFGNSLMQ